MLAPPTSNGPVLVAPTSVVPWTISLPGTGLLGTIPIHLIVALPSDTFEPVVSTGLTVPVVPLVTT